MEFIVNRNDSPIGYAEGPDAAAALAAWLVNCAPAGAAPAEFAAVECPEGLHYEDAARVLAAIIEREGVTLESAFVPFSASRNRAEKHRTLNWRCTIKRGGRDVLTADYSAGIAHAPCYKRLKMNGWRETREQQDAIQWETEKGTHAPRFGSMAIGGKRIEPDAVDVVGSLAMDSGVLDYRDFEGWASEYGYETDSRQAESIYQECVKQALAMRASFGDSTLAEMRAVAHAR